MTSTTRPVQQQIAKGNEVALHIRQPKVAGNTSQSGGRFESEAGSKLFDLCFVEGGAPFWLVAGSYAAPTTLESKLLGSYSGMYVLK
jgi:hypothetical protein